MEGDAVKKGLFLLVASLIMISLFIGGCNGTQSKAVSTTNKYPEKPITMIVPFSAGSGLDLIARALEKHAPKYLKQSLVVVNKTGGAGTIGWNELAGAAPDGYTIGMVGMEVLVQPLYGLTKYNYLTSLEPLAQTSISPQVLAIQAEQPWQNVDDLVNHAKLHPEQLKFGHGGIGSFPHILGEMIAKEANITIKQVPFRGGGEAIVALLGGHVQFIITNPAVVKEHIKSGTIRVLAVTSEDRLADPVFANVPTFKELGLNVVCNYWHGVAAPKEMPVEVRNKLAEGLKAIVNDPNFQMDMKNMGVEVEYLEPKETKTKWLSDSQTLSRTVQETGILDLIKSQKN